MSGPDAPILTEADRLRACARRYERATRRLDEELAPLPWEIAPQKLDALTDAVRDERAAARTLATASRRAGWMAAARRYGVDPASALVDYEVARDEEART